MARAKHVGRRPVTINPLNEDLAGAGEARLLDPPPGPHAVPLTAGQLTYTQNFDSLASSGATGTALPADWTFSETGGAAPTTYSVGTGSGTTGDTWSFGTAGTNPVTDRAFGSLASTTVTQILIGASFANMSGGTITAILISYVGEQWRRGGNTVPDRLDFQISFNATSLTSGSWTDVNGLDFVSINASASALTLDGNAAANRLAISFNITGVGIANGATFWIRWIDTNIAGNDDGLAIDNFALTATINRPPVVANEIPDHHSNEDAGVSYTVPVNSFSDPDGNALTYTAKLANDAPLPSWLVFTAATRTFSGTPPANFNGTLSLKVTASDGAFSVSDIFSLIIDPVNDAAVIGGTDTGAVTEDGSLTASGQLTISDVDPGESTFRPVAAGTAGDHGYGTFAMLADGSWTYTLDNADPDVQALHAVDTLADTLTILAADGTSHLLNIAIHGANEASANPYARVADEALVNSSVAGLQSQPSLTFLADGRYVIVFQVFDGDQLDVRGRIFYRDGSPAAPDFSVNTTAGGEQHLPQVAALADGGFVLVWQDSAGGSYDIRGRIYEADGSSAGEIPIAAALANETAPAVAGLPGGGFVALWIDDSDPDGDVRAQVFLANGSPLGLAFAVNAPAAGGQVHAAVTVLAGGSIVAVWEDGAAGDVRMRLFSAAGLPLTAEITANGGLTGSQGAPCVVALAGGGYAVAWMDGGADGDGYGIYARLFEADGDPAGPQFRVNTLAAGDQMFPAMAALPDGGFVVSWADGAGPDADDIRAQRFDANGVPVDAELVVNGHADGVQYQPAMAANPSGTLVVAWNDASSPGVGGDDDGAVVHALLTPGGVAPPAGPTPAIIGGEDRGVVTEDIAPTASGTLTITDPDAGEAQLVAQTDAVGSNGYGLFQINADGTWTYSIAGSALADTIPGGETRTDSIIVSSIDGTTHAIAITINGTNDAPVVTATPGTTAYSESVDAAPGALAVDNALTIADADDTALAGATVSISSNFQPGQDILAFDNDDPATFGNIGAVYDAGSGVLTLASAGGTATLAQWQAALRAVTYSNSSEEPSQAIRTISFVINDGDVDSASATRLLSVTAQNDSPSGTNATVSINEDATFTFTAAHFGFSDVDGDAFAGVRFGAAPAGGTLYFDADGAGGGTAVAITSFPTTTYSAADIAAGKLTFVPTANLNGTGAASVGFTVVDDGGTVGAGQNADTTPNMLTFNITSVNDQPSGADRTITIAEDTAYTLKVADFGFSDTDGNAFEAVIFSNVAGGTLYIDGNPMTNVTLVYLITIQSGGIVFVPTANATGAVGSLTFTVRDDGGFANGGQAADTTPNTLTFSMTAVNDAPVNSVPGAQAVDEDASLVFSTANGNALSVADVDATVLTMTLSVAHGTLTLACTAGLSFADGAGDATMIFTGTAAAINAALGAGLTYNPNANFNGSDAIAVVTTDGGQIGTGPVGVDSDSIAIDIAAINDAPAGADAAFTINEDSSFTFNESHFGFTDPVEGDDFLGVVIATSPAAGTIFCDGVAVAAGQFVSLHDLALGKLTFVPTPDANGVPYGSFTFQVRDDGGTADGGQDTDQSPNTLTFNVAAVNDAPANSVPGGTQAVGEDSSVTLSTANGNAIGVADVDAATLTVTLSVVNGTLTLASTAGLSFSAGNGSDDATMTFSGTAAAINAALGAGLAYDPTANFNGSDAISVVTTDNGQAGAGPAGTDSDSIAISVAAVNDAPSGTSATIAIDEDTPRTLTQADFGFSDPAEGHGFAGVVIATLPGNGNLLLNGVAVAVAGTFVSAAQLGAGQLVFAPGLNGNGAGYARFDFQVRDDGGIVNGGLNTDQSPKTLTFSITAVNDEPAGADAHIVMNEDSGRVLTAADFGYSDTADGNVLAGVVLTSLPTAGFLIYDPDGAGFLPGIFANVGRFVTTAELALGALTYYPASHANGAASASFTFQVRDDGGVDNGGQDTDQSANTITFDINPVNDAPSGTDNSVTGSEDDPYIFTAADFGFSDPVEGNGFLGVRIATLPLAGDILLNGVAVAAGDFIAVSAIDAGLLTFQPDPDGFSSPYASFTFQVRDDAGTFYGGQDMDQTPNTITIDILPDNLAPVLDLDAGAAGIDAALTYIENDPATAIAPDATLTDDSPDFAGGTITARFTANGAAEDRLSLQSGGGIVVSPTDDTLFYGGVLIGFWGGGVNGADLVVQLNANATAAAVEAVLRAITYANLSDDPSVPARTIAVEVADGDGGAASAQMIVNLVAVDDAAVARDDSFTIDEAALLSGNVFLDHGAGADGDVDGPGLVVAAVNGSSAHVGQQILLASGALLTLNADGSFTYATNHAFDATPTGASGASNTPAFDRFTYTLAGGGTATVTLAIAGLDSHDILQGTAGNDVLFAGVGNDELNGGAGNDVLYGEGGADIARGGTGDDVYIIDSMADVTEEAAGEGNDTIITSLSYVLSSNQEIETLTTQTHAGTDDLFLTGNQYNNTLIGNAGDNIMNGVGGADVMIGLAGDDTYAIDDLGDLVIDGFGQGNDLVLTYLNHTLSNGNEIETLSTVFHQGTTAIDLGGNDYNNTLIGNYGANYINGNGGVDVMIGLYGDDIYVADNALDVVEEIAGGGTDALFSFVSYALAAWQEVETISTAVQGGTTAINLTGNTLAQTIIGNYGANVIDGKGGNDTLYGLGGADTFAFTTALGADNVDTIADFVTGIERIGLDDGIFTAIGGSLGANAFVIGAAAGDADDRIVYNQATGQLFYDADGSGAGAAVLFATLSGAPVLTAGDFTMI